jgi:hypothetical protein
LAVLFPRAAELSNFCRAWSSFEKEEVMAKTEVEQATARLTKVLKLGLKGNLDRMSDRELACFRKMIADEEYVRRHVEVKFRKRGGVLAQRAQDRYTASLPAEQK